MPSVKHLLVRPGRGTAPFVQTTVDGIYTASENPYPARPVPIPLDDELMAEVMRDYLAATNRANELGLDFLEVHAGHGYLLHNFLSPLANTRIDDHGGTLQKRMRFVLRRECSPSRLAQK